MKELDRVRRNVKVGSYYAHYKHPGEKHYVIIEVGFYESNEEACVVYKSLEWGLVWIRTLENFLEKVEVQGKKVKWFSVVK